jgi:hypothetical protein
MEVKNMMMKNKNLRRISIVVTAQTLYHLRWLAAINGWGEKDLGRVIDKLVRSYRESVNV